MLLTPWYETVWQRSRDGVLSLPSTKYMFDETEPRR